MPVAVQRQIPTVQTVEKTMEIPQLQCVYKIVETPETQTIQDARTSERSGTAPVCQVTQVETGGGNRDRSVNPCRIRFTHIRHSKGQRGPCSSKWSRLGRCTLAFHTELFGCSAGTLSTSQRFGLKSVWATRRRPLLRLKVFGVALVNF